MTSDLLRLRPDRVSPTGEIRAGDESTRELLLDGFALDSGHGLVIGEDVERSVFGFHLPAARDLLIRLRTETLSASTGIAFVNETSVGDAVFPAGKGEATIRLPAREAKAGLNVVTIDLPLSAAATPRRPISVESIRIGDRVSPVRWTHGDLPTLEQTPGSEVSWLAQPGKDRLELACGLAPRREASEIEILAETDGTPQRVLWRAEAIAGGLGSFAGDVDLASLGGRPTRLTSRFRSSDQDASLTWTRLRLSRASPGGRRPAHPPGKRTRPNVVVFLVNTLRWDHMSLYGYPRPTSPEIARFGAGALVFDNAWTQSSWTNPAVASLFTGEHPSAHGIRDHHGRIPPGFLTVAEFLKERGYETSAVVANPGMGTQGGFWQGFDSFDLRASAKAEAVVEAALARVGPRPFFLYLHLMDSHYPYRPAPPPFDALLRRPEWPPVRPEVLSMANLRKKKVVPTPAELEYIRSLYDSEVASLDHSFGRLVQGLKERGLFDSTLIVFISDHGEEFTDHGGYYHGDTLYNELTRAALVIKPAGGFAPRTVHAPAQTIDVYPTIAGTVGESPDGLPGRDLLRQPSAGAVGDEGPVFSETDLRFHLRSVVLRRHKLILQDRQSEGVADTPWLFDLDSDPGERNNRRSHEPIRTAYLASLLRRHLESLRPRSATPARRELSEEAVRELQALGYLGAGAE